MSDAKKRASAHKQLSAFCGGFFCSFFNLLSLMIHGAKLTHLVSAAIAGDEVAYLKAIQIDRRLLIHHSYFRDFKQRARDLGDRELLRRIAYRESNPPLRGKIRYPGLYMLFALLDGMRWLDDIPHADILDLCERAGLDAYENRIKDVNALTKRLRDYRRFQKTGGLSRH